MPAGRGSPPAPAGQHRARAVRRRSWLPLRGSTGAADDAEWNDDRPTPASPRPDTAATTDTRSHGLPRTPAPPASATRPARSAARSVVATPTSTASGAARAYRSASGSPCELRASDTQRLAGGPDNVSRLAGV